MNVRNSDTKHGKYYALLEPKLMIDVVISVFKRKCVFKSQANMG